MKRNDKLLIICVAVGSAIVAFFIANFVFGGSKQYNLKAPTVDAITAEFQLPDQTYFNSSAINPTQEINIGDNSNSQPFSQ